MATKAEIIKRAGVNLALAPVGQGLQSQHNTRVIKGYNEAYETLKKEGLATWIAAGPIPDDIAPWLVAMIAESCLDTYPLSQERYARIVNKAGIGGSNALREIRRLTAPEFVSQDEADNF